MKTIEISFMIWARCYKTIEVEDNYQLNSSKPFEIVEALEENYPDQFEDNIVDDYYPCYDCWDFSMGEAGLDYIESITIYDENDNIIMDKNFDIVHLYERYCHE